MRLSFYCLSSFTIFCLYFQVANSIYWRENNGCHLEGKSLELHEYIINVQINQSLPIYCSICTCKQFGKIACKSLFYNKENIENENEILKCGSNFLSPAEHECCRSAPLNVKEPSLALAYTQNESKNNLGCLKDGHHYEHGEYFKINHSDEPNKCIFCQCKNNMIFCRVQVFCGLPNATSECCHSNESSKASISKKFDKNVTMIPLLQNQEMISNNKKSRLILNHVPILQWQRAKKLQKGDCLSDGNLRPNGTKWHPTMGPFGVLRCVVCHCNQGLVQCYKLRHKISSSVGKRTIAQNSFLRLCLPSGQDTLVYSTQRNGTQLNQFLFVHVFKLNYTRLLILEEHENHLKSIDLKTLSRSQLHLKMRKSNLRFVGAAKEKNIQNFLDNIGQLDKTNCLIRHCKSTMRDAINLLQLQPLSNHAQCRDNSMAKYWLYPNHLIFKKSKSVLN